MDAVSADDVWAVGYYVDDSQFLGFTENWNGTSWQVVSAAIPSGSTFTEITSVSAVSANDAWAVGWSNADSSPTPSLIEQWNGTSWSVVSSPNPAGATLSDLYGVSALSATDTWAVGDYSPGATDPNNTLVERHGTGGKWKIASSNP